MIFYNPQVDDFLATPLQFKIARRRALKKYGFLFDGLIKEEKPIKVCIDNSMSGICPNYVFEKLPWPVRKLICKVEFYLWARLNNLTEHLQVVNTDAFTKNSVLLTFSYKSATGLFQERLDTFSEFKYVIFHLSHYFILTDVKNKNIRKISNAILAGDSNFTDNLYYQKYFSWYKKSFLTLPFGVSKRFEVRRDLQERLKKIVATGTFHDLKQEPRYSYYKDFIGSTGLTTYHPIRKCIYNERKIYEKSILSKISYYRHKDKSSVRQFFKYFDVQQKTHFSFDIVDLYNDYQFAVVGEEVTGAPALGAFEAMACGNVLFAVPEYYNGLNLIEGKHFIGYDGTLGNLHKKLSEVDNENLLKISKSALKYVEENLSADVAYLSWKEKIENLANNKING